MYACHANKGCLRWGRVASLPRASLPLLPGHLASSLSSMPSRQGYQAPRGHHDEILHARRAVWRNRLVPIQLQYPRLRCTLWVHAGFQAY